MKPRSNVSTIIIVLNGISIILILVGWVCVSSSLKEMNACVNTNINYYKEQFKNPVKQLPIDSLSNSNVNSKDIANLNDYIMHMLKQVDENKATYQSMVNNDIDRLNTFLALGIGFLSLFGVIVPLTVNFFSREALENEVDGLKTKVKGLESDFNTTDKSFQESKKEINTKIDTANEKIAKVDNLEQKVSEAETKIDGFDQKISQYDPKIKKITDSVSTSVEKLSDIDKNKIPKIEILILQTSLSRLFNLDKHRFDASSNKLNYIKEILVDLVTKMQLIIIDEFTDENVKLLKDNLRDFRYNLNNNYLNTIADSRKENKLFNNLPRLLDDFLVSPKAELKHKFELIIAALKAIIDRID